MKKKFLKINDLNLYFKKLYTEQFIKPKKYWRQKIIKIMRVRNMSEL